MAASRKSNLRLQVRYDKKSDEAKYSVYDGRAKASKPQIKRFFQQHPQQDAGRLSDREAKIYKQFANAKFRLRDEKGHFIKDSPALRRKLNINTDLSLPQYYSQRVNEFKAANNLVKAPFPTTYNHEQIKKAIINFKHDIYVDGKKVTSLEALQKVIDTTESLFTAGQTAGLRWIDFKVTFTEAGKRMNISSISGKAQNLITEYTRKYNLKKDKAAREKLVNQLNDLLEDEGIMIGIYEPDDSEEEILLQHAMIKADQQAAKILKEAPKRKRKRKTNLKIDLKNINKRLNKFDLDE
jgi:hypothetical protein